MKSSSLLILPLILLALPAVAQPGPEPAPPDEPPAPDAVEPAPAPPPEPPAAAEPAPAPPPPPPAEAPVAAPAAEPAPAVTPKKLAVADEGWFQPGALLQGWFYWARQSEKSASTFRLRRAELKIKGAIVPELVEYSVMIDPAKVLEFEDETLDVEDGATPPATVGTVDVSQPNSSVSVLQDFYITFISDYADISIGQFKLPLSWEGYNSSSKLILPERALASKYYGDARDLGLRVEKALGDHFYYFAGVYNGNGLNRRDQNNQKDVALRVEAYPIEGIMVGAVGYTAVGERNEPGTKDRIEGDLRIALGDAVLQAEYLRGWDGPDNATRVQGHGFYGALGYTFLKRMQPVVRVGYLDADVKGNATGKNDEVWHYDIGFNYLLRGHNMKLQTSYSLYDFDENDTKSEVIVSAQVAF